MNVKMVDCHVVLYPQGTAACGRSLPPIEAKSVPLHNALQIADEQCAAVLKAEVQKLKKWTKPKKRTRI